MQTIYERFPVGSEHVTMNDSVIRVTGHTRLGVYFEFRMVNPDDRPFIDKYGMVGWRMVEGGSIRTDARDAFGREMHICEQVQPTSKEISMTTDIDEPIAQTPATPLMDSVRAIPHFAIICVQDGVEKYLSYTGKTQWEIAITRLDAAGEKFKAFKVLPASVSHQVVVTIAS